LQEDEDGEEVVTGGVPRSKWMAELDVLRRVVQSELNPLKICSSNVVMQFAKVAHSTDFIYCYSIIESNRRAEFAPTSSQNLGDSSSRSRSSSTLLSSVILGGGNGSMQIELNSFFPFDPYRLPRSGPYIEGVYREWSSVAIDEEEEEEVESDEGEASEQEEQEDGGGIAVNGTRIAQRDDETDGLGASFGGMSISPLASAMSVVPMSGVPMSVS